MYRVENKRTTSIPIVVDYKTKFLLTCFKTNLIIFFLEIANAIMASSTTSDYLLIYVGGMLFAFVFAAFGAVMVIFFIR